MKRAPKHLLIDPPSHHYGGNRLFDVSDRLLNRDDTLQPFIRLKAYLNSMGKTVSTVDLVQFDLDDDYDFISFSEPRVVDKYESLIAGASAAKLVLLEPELVRPRSYRDLKKFHHHFDTIFSHNIDQLPQNVRSKYRHLYFPQASREIYSLNEVRERKAVMIAGAHVNFFSSDENYSERLNAIAELAKFDFIHLYGTGWDNWSFKRIINPSYVKAMRYLRSVYKGKVETKRVCYSMYDFAVCFENQDATGYITEKIFDCLMSGCIPIYKGAPDISQYIPRSCYIDFSNFESYDALHEFLMAMPEVEKKRYRQSAYEFIQGDQYLPFYDSLENMIRD